MRLPTASKLSLAINGCTFPWSPHAPRWPKQEFSARADLGTNVHTLAERMAKGETDLECSPDVGVYVSAIRGALDDIRERYEPSVIATEVPYAFDCETGAVRRLPSGGQRDYSSARPSEIVGTADLVIASDSRVAVYDWKTGSHLEPTRASWQMLFLGLCVARVYKLDTVEIAQTRLEPGDFWNDRHSIDAFDLDNIEEAVRGMYRELREGQQTPKPGPHCYEKWCQLRSVCPATTATLERVSAEAHRHLPVVADIENDEQAARVRVGLKLVDEQAKAWKAKLEEYVRSRGAVPMGDGSFFGVVLNERETVDTSVNGSREIIEEVAGPSALEWSASKASIERAAALRATKRGDKTAIVRATMDRLREIGATKVSQFERLEEFKKKDDGEAA